MPVASTAPANRVTLARVAQEAGVSKALVSSLFSGRTYSQGDQGGIGVATATRSRVLRAARKLRYAPADPRIQLEMYPESGHFCFLVSRPSMSGFESYYGQIFVGAAQEMASEQSRLNLTLAQYEPDVDYLANPDELPFVIQQGMTNKFMIVGQPNYSLIMSMLERGHQAIYLSRLLQAKGVASVAPDYVQAGYLGVKHLLDLGHKNIAIAGEHYFHRLDYHRTHFALGIVKALAEVGVTFDPSQIVLSRQPDMNLSTTVLSDLRDRQQRPTAIFCLCDWTALRVIREASRQGIRVPDDLSIVGCNDQSNARESLPNISTIHFPLLEMGAHAVRWFGSWTTDHMPEPTQTLIPVRLVQRESSRAVHTGDAMA